MSVVLQFLFLKKEGNRSVVVFVVVVAVVVLGDFLAAASCLLDEA